MLLYIDTGNSYGTCVQCVVSGSGEHVPISDSELTDYQASLDARLGFDCRSGRCSMPYLAQENRECRSDGRVDLHDGVDVPLNLKRISRSNPNFDRGLLFAGSREVLLPELVRLGICNKEILARYVKLKRSNPK